MSMEILAKLLDGKTEIMNPLPLSILSMMIMFYFYWMHRKTGRVNMMKIAINTAFIVFAIGCVLKILSNKVYITVFIKYGIAIFFIAAVSHLSTLFIYSLVKSPTADERSVEIAQEVMNAVIFLLVYIMYTVAKTVTYFAIVSGQAA